MREEMGNCCVFFWGRHNKDYSTSVSILGSPISRNYQMDGFMVSIQEPLGDGDAKRCLWTIGHVIPEP